jgi:hypothetical protein
MKAGEPNRKGAGEWRTLRNEERYNLYSSQSVKKMEPEVYMTRMEKTRNTDKI